MEMTSCTTCGATHAPEPSLFSGRPLYNWLEVKGARPRRTRCPWRPPVLAGTPTGHVCSPEGFVAVAAGLAAGRNATGSHDEERFIAAKSRTSTKKVSLGVEHDGLAHDVHVAALRFALLSMELDVMDSNRAQLHVFDEFDAIYADGFP
jgi:hypothetical protein